MRRDLPARKILEVITDCVIDAQEYTNFNISSGVAEEKLFVEIYTWPGDDCIPILCEEIEVALRGIRHLNYSMDQVEEVPGLWSRPGVKIILEMSRIS